MISKKRGTSIQKLLITALEEYFLDEYFSDEYFSSFLSSIFEEYFLW